MQAPVLRVLLDVVKGNRKIRRRAMRICCLADTHIPCPLMSSRSLFPGALKALPFEEAERRYRALVRSGEYAYEAAVQYTRHNTPWDMVVHLGDVTSGYVPLGINHPSVIPLVERCKADLGRVAGGGVVRFVLGNHDVGHRKGPNEGAARLFKEMLGSLFWHEMHDGFLSVGCSTPLFGYRGPSLFLKEESEKQDRFFRQVLGDHRYVPWMLYLHDPRGIRHIARYVSLQHAEMLQVVVHGDWHNPRWEGVLHELCMLRTTWRRSGRAFIEQALWSKARLCPSVAPLWWRGYGARTVEWDGGERAKTHPVDFGGDLRIKSPASSSLKCLWWLAREYIDAKTRDLPQ